MVQSAKKINMATIRELLGRKGNDYGAIERRFRKDTGAPITGGNGKKMKVTKGCSIVIPFHDNVGFLERNLIALSGQEISAGLKSETEIIIVDDGSGLAPEKMLAGLRMPYPVTCVKLRSNAGRSAARNLGLYCARKEIVLFMDEDVVAPKDFLYTHMARQEMSGRVIVVGLRQNIGQKHLDEKMDFSKKRMIGIPSYKEDFRYEKFVPLKWRKSGSRLPAENFGRLCRPLAESGNFKEYGRGKAIGAWDLPQMFLTCNASVPRIEAIRVGGFDERFKGWGMEDVHLAAKLIADGMYLIPNLRATVYHLIGDEEGRGKAGKMKEFEKNAKLYDSMLDEELVVCEEGQWREGVAARFGDKIIINKYDNGI